MNKVSTWLKGRRVFPRWKLIALVFAGMLAGWFIAYGEWPWAVILLIGLSDLTKRGSEKA